MMKPSSLAHPVMSKRVKLVVAPMLLLGLISACSEPEKPKDFSANADQPGTASSAPAASNALVPSELTYDQRKIPLHAGGKCNLERGNGRLFASVPLEASRDLPLMLVGWVANVEGGSIPATVDIRLVAPDSRVWKITAPTGGARPDVTKLLGGDGAFANPGYAAEINLSNVPVGTYRSYVVFQDGQELKSCDNGRAIVIAQ
jgi:hypothetical protein